MDHKNQFLKAMAYSLHVMHIFLFFTFSLLAWFFTDEEFKLYSDSHHDVLEKYVVGTVPKTVQKRWFAKKGEARRWVVKLQVKA